MLPGKTITEGPALPGFRLIDKLEELRVRLRESGVERTAGLREIRGETCPFFRKSARLFLEEDYSDLKNLVLETLAVLHEVEEDD